MNKLGAISFLNLNMCDSKIKFELKYALKFIYAGMYKIV